MCLTNLNSYSGTTTIGGGSLQIGNGGGSGSLGGGPISNNGALVFDRSDNGLVVTNTISGSGSLTQIGAGTLTLTATNTYTGNTTVSAGTLTLRSGLAIQDSTFMTGGTGALSFGGLTAATFGGLAGGGNLVLTNTAGAPVTLTVGGNNAYTWYYGVLSDNAAGAALIKVGSGELTLSGSNTYTGPTTIANGVLVIGDYGSGESIGSTSGVTDNGSLFFNHTDTVVFNPVISGSGSLDQFGGALVLTNSNSFTGGIIVGGGTLQVGNGGLAGSLGSGPVTIDSTLVFNRGDSNVVVANVISGNGALTQIGTGTLTLTAANVYTGNTVISAGTLALGSGLAIQDSTFMTGGTGGLSFGGLTAATFGGLAGGGNLVLTNTAGAAVALSVGANNFSTTYSGALSDNVAGASLNKVGGGALVLTGSNTYTGPTTITAGTLQIGNGGSAGSIGGTSDVTNNGTLVFNHSNTVTVSQAISGNGALVQLGPGALVITTSNTYSGTTTISGGTLQIGNGVTDGSIANSIGINNYATLVYNLVGSQTYGNVIFSVGTLYKTGGGTLTLTGNNILYGPTIVQGGSLVGNAASLTGPISLANNATVTFSQTAAGICSNAISGSGSLVRRAPAH